MRLLVGVQSEDIANAPNHLSKCPVCTAVERLVPHSTASLVKLADVPDGIAIRVVTDRTVLAYWLTDDVTEILKQYHDTGDIEPFSFWIKI